MIKSMYIRRRFAPMAMILCSSLLATTPARAEDAAAPADANADQSIEVIRQGIAHDALFALDMEGEWGMAVGAYGVVAESKDGGAKWEQSAPPTELALLGVKRSGDHVVAVGQQGLALTRDAKGGEWKKADTKVEKRLMNVDMNESGLTFAVGEFGVATRSKDFGATWEPVDMKWMEVNAEGYEPHLYGVIVTKEGVIMVSGEFGYIMRSEDGGDTFKQVNFTNQESLFSISLANDGSNTGYAVGQEGLVMKTTDGGLTWSQIKVDTNANLLGAWSSNSEVVVVGIREMLRSSDDGATFTKSKDIGVIRTWFQGISAGVSETKAGEKGFIRQQNVFIAGYRGTIARVVK